MYIHQHNNWPNFTWNNEQIIEALSNVRYLQGKILGQMQAVGFDLKNEATLQTLTLDIIKSTEIEGEFLDKEQVRSSIARRLGLEIAGSVASDRNVDGMVDMMLDATKNANEPLTQQRLFDWHAALFPTGRSGMYKISVAQWRDDSTGPMQVVSGAMGRDKVHFQASDSQVIPNEMQYFIDWFNNGQSLDAVLKAAIAHLWFITIHPFEDGNGRMARAITDMLLTRADQTPQRFYSMSAQIRVQRKQYYEILEKTQKGDLDITSWLLWFLECLGNALNATEMQLSNVISKVQFWNFHAQTTLNSRQKLMIDKFFDGFEGKLNSSKWAKIAKCSPDTALRDIQDLIEKNILKKQEAGGRSTSYDLILH